MNGNNKSVSPYFDVPPDPERIIEGLRDTGYEFNTSMADVIDNSIAAKASNIDVVVAMDFGGNILVRDGSGWPDKRYALWFKTAYRSSQSR
jgi:hypothetical protein